MPMTWPKDAKHFLKARQAVRKYPPETIVVGLSGGADSLALTAAACAEGFEVHAVCIDHGLQEGSEAQAERAADQARFLGATAEVRRVKVLPGNLEAQARSARYAALKDSAQDRPIWVGHTMDDQAETFLLGALRGNPVGMSTQQGTIVRPFLWLRRMDTVHACAELGLKPWDDPHNENLAFRRVALRKHLIPNLSEITGNDPVPSLAMTANKIAEDNAELETAGETDIDKLASFGPARRRRSIVDLLHTHHLSVNATTLAAIDALVCNWKGQGPVAVGGEAGKRVWVARVGRALEIFTD